MTIDGDEQTAIATLDSRLRILLPVEYQDTYEEVQPVSMGSAGLKYDRQGAVAWDEIWDHFCDLAMAGGPPHKGALLEPASPAEIDENPIRYEEVTFEICRGVTMATELQAEVSPVPGWCRVSCAEEAMAGWLLRAIVMENVAARSEGRWLDLPAAPGFRLEKEIKNVITAIAKTHHYWDGHMARAQQVAIAELLTAMAADAPLVAPAAPIEGSNDRAADVKAALVERIQQTTGLSSRHHHYAGWLGVDCPSVRAAVWMMRAMVASNILSRREGNVLFVPVDAVSDPSGVRVSDALARIHRLAVSRGVL